jgi:hypothetical protein
VQNQKRYGHFHHAQFDVASALAILGRTDESIDWLTAAVRGGFPCLPALEGEPFLASIRTNPRYADLVAEVRLSREHFAKVYDELRDTISTH